MVAKLRVLVACEESGAVRRAFRALGHDAWSCDLAPARDEVLHHITGDVRRLLNGENPIVPYGFPLPPREWDLLIAFPPCTYLCNSGVRWFTTIPDIQKPGFLYGERRRNAMNAACDLFAALYHSSIPHVAIENPIMHGHARRRLAYGLEVPEFTQSIQPWQFGHGEVKRTCLWLKGLPPLTPTDIVSGREARVHKTAPSEFRSRDRAVTYAGIARAMAEQWSAYILAMRAA